ncbi:MAG: acyltransferase [Actinobacteria bacterium]|nr:acyltransferase [Actinomycetota bacterium]
MAAPATIAENPAAPPVGITSDYRPALDGIRCIAVWIVMIFHIGIGGGIVVVNGGWLGVDMFFVLSGYLITSLLLTERHRHRRISLKRFYARRFLRLAPLSIALVGLVSAVTMLGLSHATSLWITHHGAVAIVLYYANWWDIRHKGMLGSLSHAWSLSVEEQFYFVWPVMVVAAFAVARRHARKILIGATAASVVAIGVGRRAWWLSRTGPGTSGGAMIDAWAVFFRSSLWRGDGLLCGCLVALLLHRRSVSTRAQRLVTAVAIPSAMIAVLIVSAAHFGIWTPWVYFMPEWGLSTFNVCIAIIIAALVMAPHSIGARVLSLRPLTWCGRRAYGIYLVSPLVIAVLAQRFKMTRWALEVPAIVATLVVAGLSYRYFETPFLRLKERFSSR